MSQLKQLCVLAFIFIVNLTFGSQDILLIEEPFRNFGVIKAFNSVQEKFFIENKTSDTITIRLLPPDCSCNLRFSFFETQLAPYSSCVLKVWFTTPNFAGDFSTTIPLEVEYKSNKFIYALMLEAYVISQVEYYPRRLDLGDCVPGKNVEAYLYLKFPEEVTEVENIRISTSEKVCYHLALSKDRKIVRITFNFNIARRGIVEEFIYIEILREGEKQIFCVPVYGYAI